MKDKILFSELVKVNSILKAKHEHYKATKEAVLNVARYTSIFSEEHIGKMIFSFNKIGNEFANFLNELSQSNDFNFSTEKGVFCISGAIDFYPFSKGLVSSYLLGLDVNENKMFALKKLFIKVTFIQNKINAIENVSTFLGLDSELKEKLDVLCLEKETIILPQISELVKSISAETKLALEYNKLTNSLMVNGANVESEFVIHHLS